MTGGKNRLYLSVMLQVQMSAACRRQQYLPVLLEINKPAVRADKSCIFYFIILFSIEQGKQLQYFINSRQWQQVPYIRWDNRLAIEDWVLKTHWSCGNLRFKWREQTIILSSAFFVSSYAAFSLFLANCFDLTAFKCIILLHSHCLYQPTTSGSRSRSKSCDKPALHYLLGIKWQTELATSRWTQWSV